MKTHDRPNNRPVHPECLLDSTGDECTCEYHWAFWDGEPESLRRRITNTQTAESRRRVAAGNTALDLDDMVADCDLDSAAPDLTGFWKESEFLRTTEENSSELPIQNSDLDESS